LRTRLESAAAAYAAAPGNTFEFGLKDLLDGLEAQLKSRPLLAAQKARKRRRH
jgi:hypothetical protein